jgi:hypothetical protein
MDDFLQKFFPQVVRSKKVNNNYCHYDNQGLSAFTSSLYLAGMFSAVLSQYSTRNLGRTKTMLFAGSCAFIGAILNVSGINLAMLIVGRIMLGLGIGGGNQVQLILTTLCSLEISRFLLVHSLTLRILYRFQLRCALKIGSPLLQLGGNQSFFATGCTSLSVRGSPLQLERRYEHDVSICDHIWYPYRQPGQLWNSSHPSRGLETFSGIGNDPVNYSDFGRIASS